MSTRQHTPASAAVGIEHAIRMLEGHWKLVILFHLFGGRKLRFSDLERALSLDHRQRQPAVLRPAATASPATPPPRHTTSMPASTPYLHDH
jgi:hypothetical protein